ncbi:MAG: DUF2333 family protein [Geminicoccaceae bacterium]
MSDVDATVALDEPVRRRRPLRRFGWWLLTILILLCLYYAVGSWYYFRIGDDAEFTPPTPIEGGSRTVDMLTALIERETTTHTWQPDDPVFMPNGLLIQPAAFQTGMQAAWARFSIELEDQIGRTRGSSAADPDLTRARGLLNFPPDIWYFDFSKSFLPTITSEQNYRAAREALLSYNQRLAKHEGAVFDARTDSLANTIDRIALDLGSQSALIDQHLRETGLNPINFDADRLFYQVKGRLYAYEMLLRELGIDFQPVIEQKNNLQSVWNQLLDTFKEAGVMRPFFVIDGPPSGALFASHLAVQGFYVKRVVLQLNEMSEVLRN